MKPALAAYRGILHEIRMLKLQNTLRQDLIKYVSTQFKRHKVTDEKYCRANESAMFVADTYLSMLRSSRSHNVLTNQYGGRGERTTAEAAALVGLSLPKTT